MKAFISICRKGTKDSEVRAHFDGTGQILDMNSCDVLKESSEHLMYSLALHTDEMNLDFSVLDFIATSHTEADLSSVVSGFAATCRNRSTADKIRGYPRPAVVVTDQSIQCMKAVCHAFNGFSIPVYNNCMWKLVNVRRCAEQHSSIISYIFQRQFSSRQIVAITRLSHCAAHSMKNARKHTAACSERVSRNFMAVFACLIDCVTLEEVEVLLTNAVILFGSP